MGFPATRVFVSTFFLLCFFSQQSAAQSLGFPCTSSSTCTSLIDYKLPKTTSLSSILNLFDMRNDRSLLAANNLPINTFQDSLFNESQIIKIPFPCFCSNGTGISNHYPLYTIVPDDGLFHIASDVFSNLVTFPQIQTVNNISNADMIFVGQKLWIPLPCSCDAIDGETVMHYGHLVAAGNTVSGIAQQFNTTESTLLNLNGMNSSSELQADSIIDVPLKVCKTVVRSNLLDSPLPVPKGTYTFTANDCVRCQCNASTNWILECEPSGIVSPKGQICPSAQCLRTLFGLGNTTSVSTCPEGVDNANNPLASGLNGLRMKFVVGASLIVLVHLVIC